MLFAATWHSFPVSVPYKIRMYKLQGNYSLMHKNLQAILLQATSGSTRMGSYYGLMHLKIRQYTSSTQVMTEVLDLIFPNSGYTQVVPQHSNRICRQSATTVYCRSYNYEQ